MARHAAVIRHVAFEDLGSFAPVLTDAGYTVTYREAGIDSLDDHELRACDLLVVLGAPIGAYEEAHYPFLLDELRLLEQRLSNDNPTLGICLGAQLMAHALGSRVYPSGAKEIGWGPIQLTQTGRSSFLRHLEGAKVLHWHGDTFDLPPGCDLLASTHMCRNQAFVRGRRQLGVQFHPEAEQRGFERWLIGHAVELAAAGLSPQDLRDVAAVAAPILERCGSLMFQEWLANIE